MVGPKPQDPRAAGAAPQEVAAQVNEVLSRQSVSLAEEATNLEEAYRILNDALA